MQSSAGASLPLSCPSECRCACSAALLPCLLRCAVAAEGRQLIYELSAQYKNSLLLNFAIQKILMQPGGHMREGTARELGGQ